MGSISGQEDPRRKKWQMTPVILPGKFHEQRSLVGYSPWGPKKLDMTEELSTHTNTHRQRKERRNLQADRKPHILDDKGPSIRPRTWGNAYKCNLLCIVLSLQ